MLVDSSHTVFSKNLFALNVGDYPKDSSKFTGGLTLLANNALETLKNPDEVERAFENIEKVNQKREGEAADPEGIHELIEKVLQIWVKIQFGDQSRYIPKEQLQKQCGAKFAKQFTSEFADSGAKTVDLLPAGTIQPSDIPATIRKAVLVYLQTGDISDEALEEDVLTLLDLAYQQCLDGLIAKCTELLATNLDLENLPVVLDFIENRKLPVLEWECWKFMYAQKSELSAELEDKSQEELHIEDSFYDSIIHPYTTLKPFPQGTLELVMDSFIDKSIKPLKQLNNKFPIHSFTIREHIYPNESIFSILKKIAPILTNVEELFFTYDTFNIEDLSHLKTLFPKLTSFGNMSSFLKNFNEVNDYLKNFRTPEEADQDSDKLTLRGLNLNAITDLSNAQLEELTPYIQELYHINISSDEITKLVLPKAKYVDIKNCTRLETLKGNQIRLINCTNLTNLVTLEVNQAEKVNCNGCTNLVYLKAIKAKKLNCNGCTSLKTLEANQAEKVRCEGCTSLVNLKAKQSKKLNCKGCTSLKTLEANQAEMVRCEYCTSLETLKVNQAKKVFQFGCTSLVTIEADQVNYIRVEDYTKLVTLKANRAFLVSCCDCKSLKTLEADQASSVNCNGCTSLENYKGSLLSLFPIFPMSIYYYQVWRRVSERIGIS